MGAGAKLRELALELPPIPAPAGNYIAGVRIGTLLFISGRGPRFSVR